jgi:hypothetical protein
MTEAAKGPALAQLRVRVPTGQLQSLHVLARRRQLSLSQFLRDLITRELSEVDAAGSLPDESAIREMAILIAVELVLKLQEVNTPGGPSLSRRLLEAAARAAIARIEMVEESLHREAERR